MSHAPDSARTADCLLGGRYVLGELVGRGAMAEVYRARDRLLERPVAVKIFSATSDDVARRRFDEEAYVLARLAHPGLALIFDVGTLDERPFLVMEFIDGEDLRTRLASGPMPLEDVVRIGAVLADALAHAHSRGVVHRDVKPANIMLDHENLPHLTDFGIATLSGAPRLTSTNAIIGTPAYLAPEQLTGEQAGPPADVHALGLVLIECLTGEVEYPAGNNLACALARLNRAPRIPAGLPSTLADLLTAMTSAEPAARPSADECARHLLASAGEPSPESTDDRPANAVEPLAWWADDDRTVVGPAIAARPSVPSARRGWRSLTAAGVGVAAVAVAVGFLLTLQPLSPARVPTGSPAGPVTSQPVAGSGGGQAGPGVHRAGSGSAARTLVVANEQPAVTAVTSPAPSSASVPPSSAPPSTPSSAPPSSPPPTTTDAPTTTPPPTTTTTGAPSNGTGEPNP